MTEYNERRDAPPAGRRYLSRCVKMVGHHERRWLSDLEGEDRKARSLGRPNDEIGVSTDSRRVNQIPRCRSRRTLVAPAGQREVEQRTLLKTQAWHELEPTKHVGHVAARRGGDMGGSP